jgi:lipopolysaccharide export system permease protein
LANDATVVNKSGVLKLQLDIGKGYNYTNDSLSQMSFRKMYINDTGVTDTDDYKDTLQYWFYEYDLQQKETVGSPMHYLYQIGIKSKIKKFTINTLITLFPLLSVLLIPTIGIINARHQKGFTYAYIFIAIILYYGMTFILADPLGLYSIALVSVTTLLTVIYLYHHKVAKRY